MSFIYNILFLELLSRKHFSSFNTFLILRRFKSAFPSPRKVLNHCIMGKTDPCLLLKLDYANKSARYRGQKESKQMQKDADGSPGSLPIC